MYARIQVGENPSFVQYCQKHDAHTNLFSINTQIIQKCKINKQYAIYNENFEQNNDIYTIYCNRFDINNDTRF